MSTVDKNTHYTIVGTGLTGLSCVSFFQRQGSSDFRLCDSRENPPAAQKIQEQYPDVETTFGNLDALTYAKGDVIIVSPGIALTESFIEIAVAQGAVISSDIELFLNVNTKPVIAITGSNGKSTVTTLVGEILSSAGLKVAVAGNIGLPVLDQVASVIDFDIFVLELSSFQLERLNHLNAKAVCILNVTEDHMDRYKSFDDYVKAKQVIFNGAENIAVNRDETLSAPVDVMTAAEKIISFGLTGVHDSGLSLKIKDNQQAICCGDVSLINTAEMKLKGQHNINNVMAAMTLCYQAGLSWAQMTSAVLNFSGLSHRCEFAGEIDDVTYINDSKATNVGAAVAAINGFSAEPGKLILIAGGLDKMSDFRPLAASVEAHVDKVILLGQDAGKIAAVLPDNKVVMVSDLEEAIKEASFLAAPQGLVLFSPACASFDMFKSFEHRGDVFKATVLQLQSRNSGGCND
ncbi:MAG: UDP-N-acetylmuramoyl-L-alanine--D-glutamate ligase [Pseudomonadales bacterium]|nr:UDP-N-acetylmuramoyl-L-alanine--D-glutamate ligase [Pseudomonadales bacterium]